MNKLRPDELAQASQIERASKFDKRLLNIGKAGAGLAGSALSSRILPFLSEYISPEMALKGIGKISPQLGNILQKGKKLGLDINEGLNFVKENIKPAQDERNIIEQYSPELHQFLSQEIQKGRNPIEAGALAQVQEPFKKIIKKISEDHKTPFANLLQTIYGSTQQPNQNQMQQQNPQNAIADDDALLAALDRILKM